jgi:hypothetical protein
MELVATVSREFLVQRCAKQRMSKRVAAVPFLQDALLKRGVQCVEERCVGDWGFERGCSGAELA